MKDDELQSMNVLAKTLRAGNPVEQALGFLLQQELKRAMRTYTSQGVAAPQWMYTDLI